MNIKNLTLIVTFLFALLVVGCDQVSVSTEKSAEAFEASAILIEAKHEPSKPALKFGYHYSNGKFVCETYLDTDPEYYLAKFAWTKSGEQFSISDMKTCSRFLNLPSGTSATVTYNEVYRVTTNTKEYLGIEIIDVVPK